VVSRLGHQKTPDGAAAAQRIALASVIGTVAKLGDCRSELGDE
jgi:hypothetical protein